MSSPYLGEIRLFSFAFAPVGWQFCNGQLVAIQQNTALFALLGTMYGGDGRTTFALPNLHGCVAIGIANGFVQGQFGGEEAHLLTQAELPAHTHPASADANPGTVTVPPGHAPAGSAPEQLYSVLGAGSQAVTMNPAMVTSVGSSQPHPNMMPSLALSFCIAVQGIFPTRN